MQQNKLYVGNLPFTMSESDLEQAFSQYGVIEEIKLVIDRETGRSRGFAFITFATQQDAEKALSMNGQDLGGRTIMVSVAREKKSSGRRSGRF